jgi:oxygen-independent coproporphyrinogen III oxidase
MPHVEFDRDLLARYDVAAPRYTSYPTAASFGPYTEREYRDWVEIGNGDPFPRPLSLYVHLPFCATVCFYCACNRIVTGNRARITRYLKLLIRELELQSALFDDDRPVEQLALGGGTPNLLDLEQLGELVGAVRRCFTHRADREGDFSIEIDPRRCVPADLAALRALGFNRVSFGVQDLDPDVQRAVNRVQPAQGILDLIGAARCQGLRSVNVDLIYGLPRSSVRSFADTLDTVIAAAPDRLSVFGYAHLPWQFKMQRRIDPADLPSSGEKLEMFGHTVRRLEAAGYVHIGLDHFALPRDELARAQRDGALTRNFQGYSSRGDCELLGLGVSAIGMTEYAYSQNARRLADYEAAVSAGALPIHLGYVLSDDDRLRRDVILGLMCYSRIDVERIEREWDVDFTARFGPEIERLQAMAADGLVEPSRRCIQVTPRGRLLVRNIAMLFDAHRERLAQAATFSRAI